MTWLPSLPSTPQTKPTVGYKTLANAIIDDISQGLLSAGAALPTIRHLAKQYQQTSAGALLLFAYGHFTGL